MRADNPAGRKLSATAYVIVAVVIGLLVVGRYYTQPAAGPELAPAEKISPPAELASAEKTTSKTAPREEEKQTPDNGVGPQVPGGGLAAHERVGGHTLAKHVGRTAAQLQERLEDEPGISAASSFFDRAAAETAVAAALAARASDVRRWLAADADRMEVSYTHPKPVGISLRRGASAPKEARSLRVILLRRERAPLGYYILTAYPQ